MSSALAHDGKTGANIDHATILKEASGLPVIAVGKMADNSAVTAALEQNKTELIAVGR